MAHRAVAGYSKSAKTFGVLSLLTFSLSMILLNHNQFASYFATREIDPPGTNCFYSISAHVLQCTSEGTGQKTPIVVGPQNVTSGIGSCRDNPGCVGRKYRQMGPIEPGEYRIRLDTREGGEDRFRLEPVPPVPGWRVWLPAWMPGALRGGFLLGIGSLTTHGCIMVLEADSTASAQYRKLQHSLLARSTASNKLVVVR
jgi:hypothetical protein